MRSLIVCILSCAFLFGCARPIPPGTELGNFVPPRELLLVSLVKEGMIYFNQNRYIDAELRFRQAHYLQPTLPNVRANLATTLERVGQYEEAESIYLELIKEDDKNIGYLTGLGKVYYSWGRFDKARKTYLIALGKAYDASDTTIASNITRSLASMLFKQGIEDEALCYSSEALALKATPEEFQKHFHLLMALGKYRQAHDASVQFATERMLEKDPVFLHYRAIALFALKNYADAYEIERIAVLSAGPNIDPTIRFEMTMVKNFAVLDLPEKLPQSDLDEESIETFHQTVREMRDSESAQMIYWPVTLVEKVYAVPEKEEAGIVSTVTGWF